ncbi:MAG: hypothetical protein WCZ02_09910, partial [Lysobacterales bacterium]
VHIVNDINRLGGVMMPESRIESKLIGLKLRALGLAVTFDVRVNLSSGREVFAGAHIAGLGPAKGMLVFPSLGRLNGTQDEILDKGYGYSVFGIPPDHEQFDLSSYIEMFEDWNGGPINTRPGSSFVASSSEARSKSKKNGVRFTS